MIHPVYAKMSKLIGASSVEVHLHSIIIDVTDGTGHRGISTCYNAKQAVTFQRRPISSATGWFFFLSLFFYLSNQALKVPKVKVNASQSGIYVCNYNGVGSFVAISDHKEINVTTSYYIMAISVALWCNQ